MTGTTEGWMKGNIFSEPFLPSWFPDYTVVFDSEITLIFKTCSLLHVLLFLSSDLGEGMEKEYRISVIFSVYPVKTLGSWATSICWLLSRWRQLCLTRLCSPTQAPEHTRLKEGEVHPLNFRLRAQNANAISPLIVPVDLKIKEFRGKNLLCLGSEWKIFSCGIILST